MSLLEANGSIGEEMLLQSLSVRKYEVYIERLKPVSVLPPYQINNTGDAPSMMNSYVLIELSTELFFNNTSFFSC